jgi:Zn ribbon nucleic-acid-binding protein
MLPVISDVTVGPQCPECRFPCTEQRESHPEKPVNIYRCLACGHIWRVTHRSLRPPRLASEAPPSGHWKKSQG